MKTMMSEHFAVEYSDCDSSIVSEIAGMLESNFRRITHILHAVPPGKTPVRIYPSLSAFHQAIGRPDAADWVVGNCTDGVITMVSPQNPGPEHTYDSILKVAVHELVHLVADQINTDAPEYLSEGLACFLAGQTDSAWEKGVTAFVPEISTLESLTTDSGAYDIGYNFCDFAASVYGIDKLAAFYVNPNFLESLNVSVDKLRADWLHYAKGEIMKHEIGAARPDTLKEEWPGQWSVFSHYEQLCCVPGALYVVTTKKESGKINAGWFSSASFHGDGGGHFSVLPGIMQFTHTYQNILREKEFVVNFLSSKYDAHCRKMIVNGGDDVDELEAAGLTAEASAKISTPRIKEAFLSFECKLESVTDLSGKGMNSLIIGRVVNAGVDENHRGIPSVCKNFTYNIRAMTADGEANSFARLEAYE